jgi:hypothetical protein
MMMGLEGLISHRIAYVHAPCHRGARSTPSTSVLRLSRVLHPTPPSHHHSFTAGKTSLAKSSIERMVASWAMWDS